MRSVPRKRVRQERRSMSTIGGKWMSEEWKGVRT